MKKVMAKAYSRFLRQIINEIGNTKITIAHRVNTELITLYWTIWDMRRFYESYKDHPKLRQLVAEIPWGHHLLLLHEQADEILKSKYNLDFLGISRPIHERQFENKLIEKLKYFILELGYGFCFIGNQYRIALGSKEYFVNLLFFHRNLRCLVAIDLKLGSFEPEFAGKMNFYLKGINKPIAVSEYELRKTIPKKLQKQLPTAKELSDLISIEFHR